MDKKEQKQLLRAIVVNDKEYDEIIGTLPDNTDNDMIVNMVIKYRKKKIKEHLKKKPQNVALGFFMMAMVFLLITLMIKNIWVV